MNRLLTVKDSVNFHVFAKIQSKFWSGLTLECGRIEISLQRQILFKLLNNLRFNIKFHWKLQIGIVRTV